MIFEDKNLTWEVPLTVRYEIVYHFQLSTVPLTFCQKMGQFSRGSITKKNFQDSNFWYKKSYIWFKIFRKFFKIFFVNFPIFFCKFEKSRKSNQSNASSWSQGPNQGPPSQKGLSLKQTKKGEIYKTCGEFYHMYPSMG